MNPSSKHIGNKLNGIEPITFQKFTHNLQFLYPVVSTKGGLKDDDDDENADPTQLKPNTGNGANFQNYSWTQTLKELEIRIPFDNLSHQNIKLKPQDFAIEIAKNKLTAGFKNKPPILDSELPHPIKEDDSFWWVDDNVFSILLANIDQQNWWKNSLVGEFEI